MFDVVMLTLSRVECCQCHAQFGMTSHHLEARKRDHKAFWCSVCGQRQYFTGESDVERAKREARQMEQNLAREKARHDQTRSELKLTERRWRAEKAAKTRLKRKIADGHCPCCNATFADLAAHMATEHPDFCGQDAATQGKS